MVLADNRDLDQRSHHDKLGIRAFLLIRGRLCIV
jgi:hypothetical protein